MKNMWRCLLPLCIILGIILQTSSDVINIKTNQEFSEFRAREDAQVIFYYHHDESSGEFIQSRLKHVMLMADSRLEDLPKFISLGMVNCQGPTIDSKTIPPCGKGKRVLVGYSNEISEQFDLQSIYNDDSFIANMVYFVYQDEIGIAQDMSDWTLYQEEQKGKKDVILMYFKGLGNLDHYSYMEYYLKHKEDYRFLFTTDTSLAVSLGMKDEMACGLWYAKCAATDVDSDSCPVQHFSDSQISFEAIETFISLHKLPLIVDFQDDDISPFSYYQNTHILYLFVDNNDDKTSVSIMIENVIKRCESIGINFRGIIVDRRLHEEVMLRRFGISDQKVLPTAMFESYGFTDKNRQLEPFTPDEDFVEDTVYDFIYKLVKDKFDYFNTIDQLNHIDIVKAAEWVGYKHIIRKTLIGVASDGHSVYDTFKQHFRQIVRTMYADIVLDLDFVFIQGSTGSELVGFKEIPSLALVIPGKGMKVLEKFDDGYSGMLQWVNTQLGVNLPTLPLSGVDLLGLPSKYQYDENEALLSDQDGFEQLEHYQEDEVAKDALSKRKQLFYQDEVSALTDKDFKKVINQSDLAVVFFYITVDDVSYLFQPVYASVYEAIGKDIPDNSANTKLRKVNCENEFNTCRDEKVRTYPTIRFYSKGNHLGDYNGLLEEKSLIKAIRLYEQPALQHLTEGSILEYKELSGSRGNDLVSILGWFASDNKDFMIFKKVANENRGKMLFAYAKGEATRQLIGEESSSSLVLAFMANKTVRSFNGDIEMFTDHQLRRFLLKASIPKFGELTVLNFPTYKSLKQPILMLFTPDKNKMNSIAWKSLVLLAEKSLGTHVLFTWMNSDKDTVKEIRRSYIGARKERQPTIVLVDHAKGKVYRYADRLETVGAGVKGISLWIEKCLDDKVKPTSFLKKLNWNPRREGFDFLNMIDNPPSDDGSSDNGDSSGGGMVTDGGNLHGIKVPRPSKHSSDEFSPEVNVVHKEHEESSYSGGMHEPTLDEGNNVGGGNSDHSEEDDRLLGEEVAQHPDEVDASARTRNAADEEESNDGQFIPSESENDSDITLKPRVLDEL